MKSKLRVIVLLTLVALLTLTIGAAAQGNYTLDWWTVDSGGELASTGGAYSLGGSIGQPDAGTLSGGSYALTGGFWEGVQAQQAAVRYAAPGAVGNGDCSSWANACTLQTARTNAGSGDEIWVKAGVHYPGTNRTDTFTLKDGVAIYGGFAGTETSRDQRNWQTNLTILSGDIDQNDVTDPNGVVTDTVNIQGENAYHVVTGGGTDSSAVLDGFIITAGQANGESPDDSGGGMVNVNSSPSLTNVTFSNNTAYYGGGMYNEYNSSPSLTNVTFSGNSADNDGGGMYNVRNEVGSNPSLVNVILWGDSAANGAEIFNDPSSTPSISYSDIQGCGGSGAGWDTACGVDGGNNIDADPLFVDAANGNLRLGFGSPAIDAGNNAAVPSGVTTDLDGLPRFSDGDGDGAAAVEMGAYEAGQMVCGVTQNSGYTFANNSSVVITTTATLGNLACLYVDEMGLDHPNATTGLQTGRYWLIRGLQSDQQTEATGFTVTLTLPTDFAPDADDQVCRHTGSGQIWDCARSSATTNSITRAGVTTFSDWTVGKYAPPTAVVVTSFTAAATGADVTLAWETAAEFDLLVFHLYRAHDAAGPYARLTADPIPAQGDATRGASYRYVDQPGSGVYYYQLEAVTLSGAMSLHSSVRVEVIASQRQHLPLVTR